ncbi:Bug family tripartite tricarboxylate transporter substrate binding protein, partial [Pseudorhodoplanes sp.]|uniref:Bug family tripartite tricarboxylate transporter substrate binding protein n=1 Tax=Pseudorhodoplanes sp. TaxID=1934341 RepID=UPI00391DBE93
GLAQKAEDFYKDKTIRVMSVTGAGGTMDLYLLLFMKHAKKNLPAGTNLVLEHRTGGGGAVGANHLFNAAPKDGTYIGMPVPALVSTTFSAPDSVRYKPTEFQAIGRLVDNPRVFVARGDSGIKSLEDAAKSDKEITHGIMTVGTTFDQFMSATNEALGTKFRRVAGYSGGGPTFLAMEQGEVQSTTAEVANLLANKWHLVKDGKVNVLAVLGLEPVEGLEKYPNVLDLVSKDNPKRGIVQAVAQSAAIGLGLYAPPGTPQDRVEYLRKVFSATLNDPELRAEAKERNIPINYRDGAALQKIVADSTQVSPDVQAWFKSLLEKK